MSSSTNLSSRALRILPKKSYVCASCVRKANAGTTQVQTRSPKAAQQNRSFNTQHIRDKSWQPRHAKAALPPNQGISTRSATNGSLASTTAINAPTTVPHELRELHQKLQLLQDKASSYVDLSRLQLALRSLESAEPVIRVAFLGLGSNGVKAACKLVRVLLADELGDEAAWEKSLLLEADGRSVLIRYGEEQDGSGVQNSGKTLVQELRIPSMRLKRWNVEIMVTGLNASGWSPSLEAERTKELEESILVPPITIPNAGRVGFVRYPVHKALIIAEGVSGAVEFGRLPQDLVDGKLVDAALSLSKRPETGGEAVRREFNKPNMIDIDLADHALALFRSSNANGAIYSEQWQESRMGSISSWLAAASNDTTASSTLNPAMDSMLASILSRAERAITAAQSAAEASSASLTVPDAKRTALRSSVANWSEEAHRDLQMNLSAALFSPTWRRTTWWRLFWRIDEVSLSASDILRRGWLVEAEQNLAFVSGRLIEAGVASVEKLKGEELGQEAAATGLLDNMMREEVNEYKAMKASNIQSGKLGTVAELMQLPPMLARVEEQSGLNALFDPPWPQTIHLARQQMLHQLVPSLHRKAQTLMLASLSTIGGSSALAAWLWAASGGTALYEAGAIAALGLVWALRRLQKKWTTERVAFTDVAREDGRGVLKEVEGRLKGLVNDGGRMFVREEDLREWAEAKEAVRAVEEARTRVAKHDESRQG